MRGTTTLSRGKDPAADLLPVYAALGSKRALQLPITNDMQGVDWHELDLDLISRELRETLPPAEAERMVWAFEQAVSVARVDGDLLRYLLAATASLLAGAERSSPRTVFDAFFRRSVSDDEWHDRYARLFVSG